MRSGREVFKNNCEGSETEISSVYWTSRWATRDTAVGRVVFRCTAVTHPSCKCPWSCSTSVSHSGVTCSRSGRTSRIAPLQAEGAGDERPFSCFYRLSLSPNHVIHGHPPSLYHTLPPGTTTHKSPAQDGTAQ